MCQACFLFRRVNLSAFDRFWRRDLSVQRQQQPRRRRTFWVDRSKANRSFRRDSSIRDKHVDVTVDRIWSEFRRLRDDWRRVRHGRWLRHRGRRSFQLQQHDATAAAAVPDVSAATASGSACRASHPTATGAASAQPLRKRLALQEPFLGCQEGRGALEADQPGGAEGPQRDAVQGVADAKHQAQTETDLNS